MIKEREENRYDEIQNKFEQQLLIHRPEVYKDYMEAKEAEMEDNLGYEQIVWSAPETKEEAQELMEAVARAHRDFKPTNYEEDESFNQQLEALKQFKDIDITQLGEEDG